MWGQLAAALKERLSAATYAAWILPAHPQAPEGPPRPWGPGGGSERRTLTLLLPSAFALDRWRRPPIAPALAAAAASLDVSVTLDLAPAPPTA
jgi:hypothetical protein